ncbi:cAMP-specific 3',5'-cyclic phosphodiesterase 4D, partial [Coturnix japonica]|uniref:cAMP-specific 3',5'-cyclic phosphodiesterase 4D n=1 Tax=Coturnix japonica TaxID=93934 RepID=UPI0007779618
MGCMHCSAVCSAVLCVPPLHTHSLHTPPFADSALAQLYGGSPLEQHHVTVGFRLLRGAGCDIFQNLSRKQRQRLQRIVTDVVLATDMAQHSALLADLQAALQDKQLTGSGTLRLHRNGVLRAVVHCADLSNPTRSLRVSRRWSGLIMEETRRQRDKERMRGVGGTAMGHSNGSMENTQ